ncbi:MAG: four helix bundle protein, partial [Chloroflexota bacterium]
RLIKFAVRIIKISEKLPNTKAANHIAGQLLRSGTSPAPNHAEARGAESPKDFIHKLKIAVKELNETEVWLRIIAEAEMIEKSLLLKDLDECQQLGRMLSASIRTVRNKNL